MRWQLEEYTLGRALPRTALWTKLAPFRGILREKDTADAFSERFGVGRNTHAIKPNVNPVQRFVSLERRDSEARDVQFVSAKRPLPYLRMEVSNSASVSRQRL